MNRPFEPGELSGADGGEPTSAELGEVLAAARALEAQLGATDVHPSATFADRVMEAVAAEPRPQPAVAAGLALRRGRLGAVAAALADSWRVAFSGGRPLAIRAQAAAFVFVAILAAGSLGGIALVGAIDVLGPSRTAVPTVHPTEVARPTPNPATGPARTTGPTRTVEPTETPEASETPEPSETPDDTKTARPSRTAHPEDTPEPTETDDHGGDGSWDGGGGGSDDPPGDN